MKLLISLLLGGIAGSIAGKLMKDEGSFLRSIVLGIVGGGVGSFVLGIVGLSGHGLIGNMVVSVVGACIVLSGYHAITKK